MNPNKQIHDFDTVFGSYIYVASDDGVLDTDSYVSCLIIFYGLSSVTFTDITVDAEVYEGVWQAVCPTCKVSTLPISKSLSLCACVKCYNVYSVMLREDWRSVEAVLLKRPNKCNRNAIKSDTIDILLQENRDHL